MNAWEYKMVVGKLALSRAIVGEFPPITPGYASLEIIYSKYLDFCQTLEKLGVNGLYKRLPVLAKCRTD